MKNKKRLNLFYITSLGFGLFLSLFFCLIFISNDVRGANHAPNKHYISVEIQYADTLWDLAKEYMNEDYYSIYSYIDEVIEINNIHDTKIYSGNRLTLPIVQ